MNKIEFLRRLDRELSVLDKEERKEILGFYEERFYSGTIYENKTELDIVNELEEPGVIARNVLEEYGVSPKYVKSKEERYSKISGVRLFWLVIFDLLIVSWLLPTLYGVVVSIFGSLISYIGVFSLLIGDRTTMDQMLFGFTTGVYILLLLFGLVVLEVSIWVTKKVFIYHLNVFKFKNREKTVKKLNKISVDEWFKKHKLLNLIKSFSFIGAIVLMAYTGFYLYTEDENVFDVYGNQPQLTIVNQEDLAQDIIDGEVWEIVTDFENVAVEIYSVSGDEIVVTHTYIEESDYEIDIDTELNKITISNDVKTSIFNFNIEELFALLSGGNKVVIEVPEHLLLGDINIKTENGEAKIRNITTDKVDINTSNGSIYLDGITINGNVDLDTSNGSIKVENIFGQFNLNANTSNGRITLNNLEFLNYSLYTSNGKIIIDDLNVLNKDGVTLIAKTSNGLVEMNEVYVDDIAVNTSNNDIYFDNIDTDFVPVSFTHNTSNGDTYINTD